MLLSMNNNNDSNASTTTNVVDTCRGRCIIRFTKNTYKQTKQCKCILHECDLCSQMVPKKVLDENNGTCVDCAIITYRYNDEIKLRQSTVLISRKNSLILFNQ